MNRHLRFTWLLFSALLFVGCGGGSESQREKLQLSKGMSKDEVKDKYGEPDEVWTGWGKSPDDIFSTHGEKDDNHPFFIETLHYGAKTEGDTTTFDVSLTFVHGKLESWKQAED